MPNSKQQLIVCAALQAEDGLIVCGPRHYDKIMLDQTGRKEETRVKWLRAKQGFVDQFGKFLTREEAWPIAEAAGQIRYRCGGDGVRLFSENLY